jgi:hypothetical protein
MISRSSFDGHSSDSGTYGGELSNCGERKQIRELVVNSLLQSRIDKLYNRANKKRPLHQGLMVEITNYMHSLMT